MKLVIAGGSGFLGSVLIQHFKNSVKQIVILSRQAKASDQNVRYVVWDAKSLGAWQNELNHTDALINLTGRSVNCRYTEKNKAEILNSRLESTRILGEAIRNAESPPKCWIQAASATIYNSSFQPIDETSNNIGHDFSMSVCQKWERTFWDAYCPETKKVLMRVAIVLGQQGGAWPVLKRLAQFGLGGKQGNGSQRVSWIHQHDFARVVEWIMTNGKINGVYNVCSPNGVNNQQFMSIARKAIGNPIGLPAPEWLLHLGAAIIGTETELILKSRCVAPQNLWMEGFRFEYNNLKKAIHNLTNES